MLQGKNVFLIQRILPFLRGPELLLIKATSASAASMQGRGRDRDCCTDCKEDRKSEKDGRAQK